MRGGPARRLLLLVLAVLSLSVAGAAPAGAHAYLLRTNPGDGTTLRHAPAELRLCFSEHVVLGATRLELVAGSGHHVRLTDLRLSTADPGDTETPSVVAARLPRLAHDTYRLSWETLSSDDLHRTAGLVVFGVGRPVTGARVSEPLPRPEEAALRLLLLAGLCLALGGPLAAATLRPVAAPYALRRVRLLALGGALGAAVTAVALLADQLVPGGLSLHELTGTRYQLRWLVRESGLLLLAAAALLAVRRPRPRLGTALLLAGAALACGGTALLGHAGAGSTTRVLVTAVHLAAATTWVGAVAGLAVALTSRRPALGAALRAFAWPAAGCVTVAGVTGVWLAGDVVGSVDAVLRTVYGRTLLAKVTLVGVAGLLALVNHRRLRRRHHGALPTRTVRAEAAVATLVVAATAVLTSGQPATEPALVRPVAATHGPVSRLVGDLQEAVTLRPDRPGANVVTVDVFDSRRPSPGPVTAVDVALPGQPGTPATPLPDGHWVANLPDVPSGPTHLRVTVHRTGLADTASSYGWTVPDGLARPPVLVSDAPAGAALRTASGLLAVLAGAGWGLALVRQRRGRHVVRPPHRAGVAAAAVSTTTAVLLLAGVAGPGGAGGPGPVTSPATTPVSAAVPLTTGPAGTGVAAAPAVPAAQALPAPLVLAGARPGTRVAVSGVLLSAYRDTAAGAPARCHLQPSLLAAVVTAQHGWTRDLPTVRHAAGRAASALCRDGQDLGQPARLAAAVRSLDRSPGFADLVHRLAERLHSVDMDTAPAPAGTVAVSVPLRAYAVRGGPVSTPASNPVAGRTREVLGRAGADPVADRTSGPGTTSSVEPTCAADPPAGPDDASSPSAPSGLPSGTAAELLAEGEGSDATDAPCGACPDAGTADSATPEPASVAACPVPATP